MKNECNCVSGKRLYIITYILRRWLISCSTWLVTLAEIRRTFMIPEIRYRKILCHFYAFIRILTSLQSEYTVWWSRKQLMKNLQNCPDDTAWNVFVCIQVLMSIVILATDARIPYYNFFDVFYNVVYAIHVLGIAYNLYVNGETSVFTFSTAGMFLPLKELFLP